MRSIGQTAAIIFLSGMMGGTTLAQPPKLEIEPIIVAQGDYVTFSPTSDAVVITYIGLSGVEPFPSDLLKDGKSFILPVRGLKPNSYRFVAIGIRQNEFTRKEFVVRVNGTPGPTPDPEPEPEPDPQPDPKLDDAPVKTDGLHVTFVYETGQRLTQSQFNILYGQVTRDYLNTVCDRTSGQPNWRVLDKDSQALTEPWKDILKRKKTGIPGLVIVSGKKYVYEGDIPGSTEEFLKLLDKYKPKNRTDYCPTCPAPYTFQQTPLSK